MRWNRATVGGWPGLWTLDCGLWTVAYRAGGVGRAECRGAALAASRNRGGVTNNGTPSLVVPTTTSVLPREVDFRVDDTL